MRTRYQFSLPLLLFLCGSVGAMIESFIVLSTADYAASWATLPWMLIRVSLAITGTAALIVLEDFVDRELNGEDQ